MIAHFWFSGRGGQAWVYLASKISQPVLSRLGQLPPFLRHVLHIRDYLREAGPCLLCVVQALCVYSGRIDTFLNHISATHLTWAYDQRLLGVALMKVTLYPR